MKSKITLLFLTVLFFTAVNISAQEMWGKIEKKNFIKQDKQVYAKKNFPASYELVSLDINKFIGKSKSQNTIIELPNSEGVLSKFRVKETSNFEQGLQDKFPNIKSYTAQGIDDPTAVAKISLGTDGFHAVIFSGKEGTIYIDPYSRDNKDYIVYGRNTLSKEDRDFKCMVEDTAGDNFAKVDFAKNANDGKLRTFRLAIVCSGEYAQFHLGASQQNVASDATDEVKKAAVLSAMNTSMTRINGVFEKDLAVKMVIVADNDKVIFLDAASDGLSDGNANTMINEVQEKCDALIGDANYDIGHIFSIGGSGLAGLGVVCVSGSKARGVTGIPSPVGDPYDIDYVAHEIGHQFGATHTQNNSCNRTGSTAVEPGSASTIMGYAGICAPNVLSVGPSTGNSDDYFHAVNIAQMWARIQSSASCGVETDTNNTAPVAIVGPGYSVPKSTPLVLRGSATDVDGMESLTYNWEQIDTEVAAMPPVSSNTGGPTFRSLPSKISPNRYLPDLSTVVAGNLSTEWEVLPSVAREMNFSFLVRDNHAGGGSTARDDMNVNVTDADAFTVNGPASVVTWNTGETKTVSWVVGTTNVAPINCQNVNIRLSTDGGLTFPVILKENTPNDGSEDIVVPDNGTTAARIMVEAADNIFYNLNSTNFTINSTTPTFIMTNTSGIQTTCNSGENTVSYSLDFNFVNGFTEQVSFSTTGQPTGSAVAFSPATISANGTVIVTVSNLDGKADQDYAINVMGNSTSVNQDINLTLQLKSPITNALNLTSPADNATSIGLSEILMWDADSNATSYDVEIASDSGFSSIVSNGNVSVNSYTSTGLSGQTTYYWRVKPKNVCGEGSFSNTYSFTTIPLSYCASTFTKEGNHIQNVTFNTINNDSGNDTDDGYEDYTAISTIVKRGETHQISVTVNPETFQDHCFVFIDWNRDGVFNTTDERFDLGTQFAAVGTLTFDITIPNDARFGTTRIRVITEYTNSNSSPNHGMGACDSDQVTEYGETEDYSLVVDATAAIEDITFSGFNLYPNPTKGAFNLNFEVVNSDKVSIQLFDIRGRLIGEKNFFDTQKYFSETINFEKASTGLYLLKINNGDKQTTRKLIIK
jgi:hypothetical protein